MITRDVARVTLELTSPLSIGRGEAGHLADLPFVVDCNGLPTVPGTSLTGVLRAHAERVWDVERLEAVFGSRQGELHGESHLSVSFGHVHDGSNRPVPARASLERLEDPLLRTARESVIRTHVRLDHRGTADHRGLYDEQVVPRGHRFTFELELRDRAKADLDEILGFLASPDVRLGARTRAGLGAFTVVSTHRRRFVLDDSEGAPDDWTDYARLPSDVAAPPPVGLLPAVAPSPAPRAGSGRTAVLDLEASGTWLIGNGTPLPEDLRDEDKKEGRQPDLAPWREPRVVWSNASSGPLGSVDLDCPDLVIPGSAIKGALKHRTAYYLNGRLQQWADQLSPKELVSCSAHELPELRELFGHVPAAGAADERALAGRVVVEEAALVRVCKVRFEGPTSVKATRACAN